MSMLDIKSIETSYGETQVLFDVSLNIAPGEVVSLLGPNGAGKTTTLRSILGLTAPTRGSIYFDGVDVTRLPTHKIAGMGIGWVPDDRRIFPTLPLPAICALLSKKHAFAHGTKRSASRSSRRWNT